MMLLKFVIFGIVLCVVYIKAEDGTCANKNDCFENIVESNENMDRYDEGNRNNFTFEHFSRYSANKHQSLYLFRIPLFLSI